MPDICGYWDRRTDDPNYKHDDAIGRPVFTQPGEKGYISQKEQDEQGIHNMCISSPIEETSKEEQIAILEAQKLKLEKQLIKVQEELNAKHH